MHWSPFAWLVLVAESTIGKHNQQARTAWSLASNDGSSTVTDMHACFMDCEQDDSEWNLVQVRCASVTISMLTLGAHFTAVGSIELLRINGVELNKFNKQETCGVLQTPNEVLPPPPSAVVDTEHWERAMFRDRQERFDRAGGRVAVWPEKLSSWVRRKD